MNSFQVIVLSIAIVILVLVLTFIGIVMGNQNNTTIWPPSQTDCPDYWEVRSDGSGCNVPINGKTNSGPAKFSSNTYALLNDPSISSGKYINFKDSAWANVCTKKCWATNNGIHWDGVTDYNGSCGCT